VLRSEGVLPCGRGRDDRHSYSTCRYRGQNSSPLRETRKHGEPLSGRWVHRRS
jgi:hypothetical protein